MTLNEIKTAAMDLSPQDREALAEDLMISLSDGDRADIEQAWAREAMKRSADCDAGRTKVKDMDEVLARLRGKSRA